MLTREGAAPMRRRIPLITAVTAVVLGVAAFLATLPGTSYADQAGSMTTPGTVTGRVFSSDLGGDPFILDGDCVMSPRGPAGTTNVTLNGDSQQLRWTAKTFTGSGTDVWRVTFIFKNAAGQVVYTAPRIRSQDMATDVNYAWVLYVRLPDLIPAVVPQITQVTWQSSC
jgi:hypothetical protein